MTAEAGIAQFLSGNPDFTQTKTYRRVPLPLTMVSWVMAGSLVCAFSHAGTADMSMDFIFGASPANATLPVTVAPLASSGIAPAPPAAGAALSVFAVSGGLSPPHPTSVTAQTSPTPIQIFFMILI